MSRARVLAALLAASGWFLAARPGAAGPPEASAPASVGPTLSVSALTIIPGELTLDDAGDLSAVVVQATLADGTTRDVTAEASLAVVGSSIVCVDTGFSVGGACLLPLRDGQARLVASWGGQRQEAPLTVRGTARARPVSFQHDVLPVLTRAGCNTGSCHGSSRGKDGFHLSLFGYDPAGDHQRITREQPGRRINLAVPDESLLLRKALGQVRHTGGRRLEPGSDQAETVLAWIAAGAPADPADLPALEGLELLPAQTVLLEGRGQTQRVFVRARYAGGEDRDVTALAAFGSSDPSVASLSTAAPVIVTGRRGEAWITARFADKVVAAQVLVVPDAPGYSFPADEPQEHPIDRLVNERLRRLRRVPAPPCDDATYLRRVTLDLVGRLPAPEEVEAFLADAAPDKRARAVDRLLDDPAFAKLISLQWAERLLVRSDPGRGQLSEKAALRYADWIGAQVAARVPLDRMVRDLLTATGETLEQPATNFFHAEDDPKKTAENVAQVFLGLRLQCAQCHNHPFDRWTQDDYYGFAAFFARVGRKPADDPRERVIFERGGGELAHPVTKQPVPPRFLGGERPEIKDGTARRRTLAAWLTAPENPWFAANAANLVWAQLFGTGLVHEPDDARVSNPPANPALLDALAARLRDSGYDLRDLVRFVCSSRAYQRASQLQPGEAPGDEGRDDRTQARAHPRRLRAEVLLDAISQVTEAPDDFRGLPPGGKAVEIPDGAITDEFLTTFGRSARESVCTCEARAEPNLGQALHLLNGDTITRKLRQGKLVPRLWKELGDPAAVVRALYLRALSRPPRPDELAGVLPLVTGKDPVPALEDLLWALLNSREFLFNH